MYRQNGETGAKIKQGNAFLAGCGSQAWLVVKDVLQAPVVSARDPSRIMGIVTLHDIARQQNTIDDSLGR